MTPDTHTFWDPEKGRYVTIPLASVIKPPTEDEQTAHKAVVAVDAVVTKVVGGFVSGFLKALLFLVFVFAWIKDHPSLQINANSRAGSHRQRNSTAHSSSYAPTAYCSNIYFRYNG